MLSGNLKFGMIRKKYQEPNSKNQAPLLRFGRPTGGGQARQALNSKINAKYQRKRGILEFAIWDLKLVLAD